MKIQCTVNGQHIERAIESDLRLLDFIREVLHLTGTKEGCGEGECGACSILLNGVHVLACLTLAAAVPNGADILTVEGLEKTELGQKLQAAFLKNNAVQCGFCTPGMLIASYALLSRNPNPGADEIKIALSGNLCRCTGYQMIIEAVSNCASQHAELEAR